MTVDAFWHVIGSTAAPTQEKQLEKFRAALRYLNHAELVGFSSVFTERFFAAYDWDIWTIAWLCGGGFCSDDRFMDFRYWLLSRGRAVFDMALNSPDDLIAEISTVEYPRFETFGYVPDKVYRERFEAEPPDTGFVHPEEPSGGSWLREELKDRSDSNMLNLCVVFGELGADDFRLMAAHFPRTWAYCVERGIINPDRLFHPRETPQQPEPIMPAVDPNLAKTDFASYLKALHGAAGQLSERYRKDK